MSYGIGKQSVGDKIVFRRNNPITWAMTEGREYRVVGLEKFRLNTFISVECDDGVTRSFSPGSFEKSN